MIIQKKKPTAITVIGWIFIVISISIVLSSMRTLRNTNYYTNTDDDKFRPMLEETFGPMFKFMSLSTKVKDLLVFYKFILFIFVLFASIQFLRLRPWARTVLEGVCWLSLIQSIGLWMLWIYSLAQTVIGIGKTEFTTLVLVFAFFGVVTSTLITALFSIPVIILITYLRRNDIKRVFA